MKAYAPITKAKGQTKLAPPIVTRGIADASQLMRNTCSPSAKRLTNSRERSLLSAVMLSDGAVAVDPRLLPDLQGLPPYLQELVPVLPWITLLVLLMEMTRGEGVPYEVVQKHGNESNSDSIEKWKEYLNSEDFPELDEGIISQAIKGINENKRNHILLDKHKWNSLVPNPKDPNNWGKITAIISLVLSEGVESFYKNGPAYMKTLEIRGEIVDVVYRVIDGVINISDAWVR